MDGKISSFWIERMIALSGPEACSVFPLPPRATCRAADAGMCPKSPFHPRDEGLALLAGRSDVRASVSASELLRCGATLPARGVSRIEVIAIVF